MNKSMKRFVSVLLAVVVLSALGASALAEDGELYTVPYLWERLFGQSAEWKPILHQRRA